MVVIGGGSMLPGITERAKLILQADVVIADPFKKVDAPAFLEEVLKNVGPEFDVELGVALRKLEEEA